MAEESWRNTGEVVQQTVVCKQRGREVVFPRANGVFSVQLSGKFIGDIVVHLKIVKKLCLTYVEIANLLNDVGHASERCAAVQVSDYGGTNLDQDALHRG